MQLESIRYHHSHDEPFLIDRPNGSISWLFLIIKTPALFRENGIDRHISSNSFVLYDGDCPQHYGALRETYTDDWFHFYPNQAELQLLKQLQFPVNTVCDIEPLPDISGLVRLMCHEFHSQNTYRIQTINLYFQILLYKINERVF